MLTRLRPYLPAAVDAVFLFLALVTAYNLVFGFAIPHATSLDSENYTEQLRLLLPWWVLTHVGLLAVFPLYRGTARPAAVIAGATACHFVLWAIFNVILAGREGFLDLPTVLANGGEFTVVTIPWDALILYSLLAGGFLWGWRQLPLLSGAVPGVPATARAGAGMPRYLVGDGPAAERLLKRLRESGEPLPSQVITRDVARVGGRFSGIPIVGTVEKLPDVLGANEPAEVLLAAEKRDAAELRRMLDACQACRGRFLLAAPASSGHPLRPLAPADLFGWAETLDKEAEDFPKPRVRRTVIVGGGGALGRELAGQLAALGPETVWLVEQHQEALEAAMAAVTADHPKASVHGTLLCPGDANGVAMLMERARPQAVLYAAQWDSVSLLEDTPGAAVRQDVLALAPWIRLAHGLGVDAFVLVSRLQAGDPSNVAAASLRLAEQVALSRGARSECRFTVLRLPEVVERHDSLVSRLCRMIAAGGTIRLPHPDVEVAGVPARWAARLVLGVLSAKAPSGVLAVAPPIRLKVADVVRQLLAAEGRRPGKDVQLEYTGLPDGERLREPAPEGDQLFAQMPQVLALEHEELPSPEALRETLRTVEWLTEEERPETLLAYLAERIHGYVAPGGVTWNPAVLENTPWAEAEEIMPPAPELPRTEGKPRQAPEPVEDLAPPEPEPEPVTEEEDEPERLASPPGDGPTSSTDEKDPAEEGEDGPFEERDLFTQPRQTPTVTTGTQKESTTEERIEESNMSTEKQTTGKGCCLVLSVTKDVEAETLKMLLEQLQKTILGENDRLVCLVEPEDAEKLPEGVTKLVRGTKPSGALMNEAMETHPGADMLLTLNSEVLLKEGALEEFRQAMADGTPLAYSHFEEDRAGERTTVTLHDHEGCPHERFEYGPVIAYRTDAIKEAGGIRPDLNVAWEYDLHLKLMEKKPFKRIKEPLYTHFLKVVEDKTGKKVFSPGAGPLGGFSYVFYPEEVEREVTSVFEDALKRRGAWLDHPTVEVDHKGKKYEVMATVVIPVLNRAKFIGNAIERLLVNTYKDFEVVVVDNGSTDGTIEIVEEFAKKDPRVRLVHGKGSTIASALNEGIRAARGKYIFQHDSDDQYDPTTIEKFVEHLESHPKCGLAISYYRLMDEDANVIEEVDPVTHHGYTRNQILRRDGAGACRVFPKAVLEEFGLYDEEHYANFGEDYDMVLKAGEKYDVDRIHEVLYYYRRHPDNTDVTRDPEVKYKNKNRARQEALRRRIEINKRLGKA